MPNFEVMVRTDHTPAALRRVSALDAPAAAQAMEREGWEVLNVQPVGFALASITNKWVLSSPSSRFDVAVFIEQLHDLLTAGLSLIEALETLQNGASATQLRVLAMLALRLREGVVLSAALAEQPAVFPALLVALVSAAEQTSDLPSALDRYRAHHQRVTELRHRLVSIAIYPSLVVLVGALVLMFLLMFVVPRFSKVFESMGGPLPWTAEAMLWWAQWLKINGRWVWAVLTLAGCGLLALITNESFRQRMLSWTLELGPIRRRLRIYFLARWYRTLGLLIEGGIPLTQALPMAHEVLPSTMQRAAVLVEAAVRGGLGPAQAFGQANMVTPVSEQLMRASDQTGALGAVMQRIAQFHEAELGRALEKFMRAFEPIVMALIGVGVGLVVVLMYMPIFELASAIQ